jgi:formate dehydrogenase major subunit
MGADICTSHPVLTVSINRARKQGAFVSLIGHENSIASRLVDSCIPVASSHYLLLLADMLKMIVDKEAYDKDFVTRQCDDFDLLKKSLLDIDPEKIAALCGLSQETIDSLGSKIRNSKRGCILYGPKILESNNPQQIIRLLFNILLLMGGPSSLIPLRCEGNDQGVGDMGALPGFLPGYQRLSDQKVVSEFEKLWSTKLPIAPGMSYPEMLKASTEGTLKALYVTDGAIPEEASLGQVDFLVLHGIYPSPLFEVADVVFPATAFTEEEGTIISLERRVQPIAAAVHPVGMAMPDWKIVGLIAQKMHVSGFEFASARDVFNEICNVHPFISGEGIWSVQIFERFRLTPVQDSVPGKSAMVYRGAPRFYRGVDVTDKVHDLRVLYERVSGG